MLITQPYDPAARGHNAVYRAGEINNCPGCGRTHWIIGRISAECGFCTTAIPLAGEKVVGAPTLFFTRGNGGPAPKFRSQFILNGQAA